MKISVTIDNWQVARNRYFGKLVTRAGFSLIEILVVVALLSLIVLALMAVFSSTQNAFRSSVTQTDVLEGGRATMDLIAADFKEMAASSGRSNGAVNFYAEIPSTYTGANSEPLVQSLPASGSLRTNVIEDVFLLSRENQTWTGVGYKVDFVRGSPINGLYRFSWSTNIHADPAAIFAVFTNMPATNMSHILDGVVQLSVNAYDTNGVWITKNIPNTDVRLSGFVPGQVGLYKFYGTTLPASVEIELGVLEDRALRRAESIGSALVRSNYLVGHAGQVHIFRQRVAVPNVDPSAY